MKKIVAVLVMVLMAVGFDWSLSQETNDVVQITIKNQFSYPVSIYVNGTLVCYAKVDSSCTVPVKIGKGPYKLEARGGAFNNVMASETFDPLPGENMTWETGNVELNPIPRQCMIAMYNPYNIPVRFYINGKFHGWSEPGSGFYWPTQVNCNDGPFEIEIRSWPDDKPLLKELLPSLDPEHVYEWHPDLENLIKPPTDEIKKPENKGSNAGTIIVVASLAAAAGAGAWYFLSKGPYDGTYSGEFWAATPCVFPPCSVSHGNASFTVARGVLSGGGALEGQVDKDTGQFTGTWTMDSTSKPFPMYGSFKNSPVVLEGPNKYKQGTLSARVKVNKQ